MQTAADDTLPLIPRSIPAILADAWRLYRRRLFQYFLVSAAALLFAWTLDLVLRVWTIGDLPLGALEDSRTPAMLAQVWRIFAAGIANGMIYALLGFAAQGVLALDAVAQMRGENTTITVSILAVSRRCPALAVATLLFFGGAALMVSLGSLLSGVAAALGLTGGVFSGFLAGTGVLAASAVAIFALTLRWALFPQAVVLEGLGPVEALGRSMRLTRAVGRAWSSRLAELYLVRAAILMLALIAIQMAAGAVGAIAKLAAGWLFGGLGDLSRVSVINPTGMPIALLIPLEIFAVLLSAAVLPYALLASTLLYLDVRARREVVHTEPSLAAVRDAHIQGGNS